MRVLIGGVGYRNLRDYSIGVAVTDRLMERPWPTDVLVEDLSYNPIALVQRLEDDPPERRRQRGIFVAGVARGGGRSPGTITAYRWDQALPSADAIQSAIAEGITGVISLDNTLVVLRYFGVLPAETLVVEIEPLLHEFGESFSPAVGWALEPVCGLVTRLALDTRAAAMRLVEAPLGGGALVATGPFTSAERLR